MPGIRALAPLVPDLDEMPFVTKAPIVQSCDRRRVVDSREPFPGETYQISAHRAVFRRKGCGVRHERTLLSSSADLENKLLAVYRNLPLKQVYVDRLYVQIFATH